MLRFTPDSAIAATIAVVSSDIWLSHAHSVRVLILRVGAEIVTIAAP